MAECSDSSVSNNVNTQKQNVPVGESDGKEEDKTDKASELLLIEDLTNAKFPESFVIAQEELGRRMTGRLSRADIIVILAYILMLEEGFVPLEKAGGAPYSTSFHRRQVAELARQIPRNWKRSGFYEFAMALAPYSQYVCRIVCTTTDDELIINCKVQGLRDTNSSILVDPAMYIVETPGGVLYQNIRMFMIAFKTNISNRAKANILRVNYIARATIQDMPPEILLHIYKFGVNPSLLMLK